MTTNVKGTLIFSAGSDGTGLIGHLGAGETCEFRLWNVGVTVGGFGITGSINHQPVPLMPIHHPRRREDAILGVLNQGQMLVAHGGWDGVVEFVKTHQ